MNRGVANVAKLTSSLKELLEHEFGAQLVGSWATLEPHLPVASCELVSSFSDVDVLADGSIQSARLAEIQRKVFTLVRGHGVEVARVSVRSRSEIEAFWQPRQLHAEPRGRTDNGRFMLFWTLIGAIETCFTNAKRSERALSYAVVKFFFKMSRNLLLLRGGSPSSYRDVAKQICVHALPPAYVCRAYAVKVGESPLLSTTASAILLSDAVWQPMLDGLVDSESMQLLAAVRADILKWHKNGVAPNASAYIAQLQVFDEEPNFTPARLRTVQIHGNQSRD